MKLHFGYPGLHTTRILILCLVELLFQLMIFLHYNYLFHNTMKTLEESMNNAFVCPTSSQFLSLTNLHKRKLYHSPFYREKFYRYRSKNKTGFLDNRVCLSNQLFVQQFVVRY